MVACRLSPHELWVVAKAEYWTACAFRGRGVYDMVRCATRSAAITAASQLADGSRGAMVYAVFRTHQALTDTVKRGEQPMTFLLRYRGYAAGIFKELAVTTHPDRAQAQAYGDGTGPEWAAFVVESENDLDTMGGPLTRDIFNTLRPEGAEPIKAWKHGAAEGRRRLFTRMVDFSKGKPMEPVIEPKPVPLTATQTETSAAALAGPAVVVPSRAQVAADLMQDAENAASTQKNDSTPAAAGATSSATEPAQGATAAQAEDDMAKKAGKATRKARAKKANNGELRGKQAKLYTALCREGGATVGQLNAATGWKESRATAKLVCEKMGRKLIKIEEEGKEPRYAAK